MSELEPTSTELEPTATERLRALLDERGVEWSSPSGLNSSFADSITFIGDVAVVSEIEGSDLLRINFDGTPEQAIAATLGMTCRDTESDPTDFCCSECGARMYTQTADTYTMLAGDGLTVIGRPNFCANCGARVVG